MPKFLKNIFTRKAPQNVIMLPALLILLLFSAYLAFSTLLLKNTGGELYPEKVIIGLVRWPGYLPLYVAAEKGYFKKYGIDVEIKTYDNNLTVFNDYRDGKIQAIANTSFEFIDQRIVHGIDHKAVLAIDRSLGADAVIASTNINYLEDLRGKKVAFEYKTLEEFLLRFALKKAGLSIDDITPVDLSPILAAEALVEGRVDAAVTFEPSLSKAVKTGKVNIIYSTAQDPGIVIDLLNFKTDFIEKYPQTVSGVVAGYFDGFKYFQNNPDESYAIAHEYLNGTSVNVKDSLNNIQPLNLLQNEVILTSPEGSQSLQTNLKLILDFINKERGILFSKITPESLIDSTFVDALFYVNGNNQQ